MNHIGRILFCLFCCAFLTFCSAFAIPEKLQPTDQTKSSDMQRVRMTPIDIVRYFRLDEKEVREAEKLGIDVIKVPDLSEVYALSAAPHEFERFEKRFPGREYKMRTNYQFKRSSARPR